MFLLNGSEITKIRQVEIVFQGNLNSSDYLSTNSSRCASSVADDTLPIIPASEQPMSLSQWQFWIDRGGTFTDIVARKPDGSLVTHKLLSENPERYEDAATQGIRDLLGIAAGEPIPAEQVAAVKMGTTVGTNALL